MYKCQMCKRQSAKKDTQFNLITKKRELEKGFEIAEEKKVCLNCWLKQGE
jgi:hypothetical protein